MSDDAKAILPTLLYVDHIYHTKTKSTDFCVDMLRDHFEVRTAYFDPDARFNAADLIDDSDYVVIFQLDYLAPLFVAAGKRVIVIPMYDGSAHMPDMHWLLLRQARFINFSYALHARALAMGCQSRFVQFFPEPAPEADGPSFESRDVFFWERQPETGISVRTVKKLLAGRIDSMHVHRAADPGQTGRNDDLSDAPFAVTVSDWFEERADYDRVLKAKNILVAPRHAEGIGMGFLEAMARGMVPIAYDLPTHNEYIEHGTSGFVFTSPKDFKPGKKDKRRGIDNSRLPPKSQKLRRALAKLVMHAQRALARRKTPSEDLFTPANLARIGRNARARVVIGREAWERAIPALTDFVRTTEPAQIPREVDFFPMIEWLISQRQLGLPQYEKALHEASGLVHILAHWASLRAFQDRDMATLSSDIVLPLQAWHMAPDAKGWVEPGPDDVDLVADQPSCGLTITAQRPGVVASVRILARGTRPGWLTLLVNGQPCGEAAFGPDFDDAELALATPLALAAADRIDLQFAWRDAADDSRAQEAKCPPFVLRLLTLRAPDADAAVQ